MQLHQLGILQRDERRMEESRQAFDEASQE